MANKRDILHLQDAPAEFQRSPEHEALIRQAHADDALMQQFNEEARRRMAEPAESVDLKAELAAICAELEAPTDDDPKR